ncbi:putative histone-lysine N-methyltransferase chromatin regulator PHD family [Rosa chinensis]|uniref:Putative histone-lysine N-methyltransferase chromatin regulator PHD family n=1 Tax=Rosa chinensis TaxID=74649 RepID=A0A2P6S7N9_ROSCH|nr:putative histone-lysine N-methyltransferase chromatin regulator PHD family [Rosa chinensis]
MAFHVACPITCRRICFCPLGFPRSLATANSKACFLDEVIKVHDFLSDPSGIRARGDDAKTVQVAVPKVAPPPPPPPTAQPVPPSVAGGDAAVTALVDDESAAAASAQAKRAALQRKAAADMVAAEDFARRFESGDLSDTSRGVVGEEQGQSNVMCRICFCGENEGSQRARRMLPCKTCGKKYHRNCLKTWSQHRDLFHWSSWACPRAEFVCRRTGDPNKLMFCKRCDGAYHCYCQHPSHKNVSAGVYVCPKHTKCHSCGSNVPGNGLSVRWFLGYTCCDACGRLFVKGNYCPVCLKVYRDSESTPMVCCDICQRWVHCHCDGISDEKYQQYQLDGNLQYKCATCRGECHQVKNHEDAAKELWKRKDEAERDLITSLRAAAGLPAHEEIFSIPPYSDDEENGPPIPKSEYGRPLKLSLKGLVDKSPKKTKDSGKKSLIRIPAKKKEYQEISISNTEANQSVRGHDHQYLGSDKNDEMHSSKNVEPEVYSSPLAGSVSHPEEIFSVSEPSVLKHKFVDEVMLNGGDRTSKVRIKGKSHGLDSVEDTGKHAGKSKPVKEKKLVINFGAKKLNITKSPSSDASTYQREHASVTSNGGEDANQRTTNTMVGNRHDGSANFGDAKGVKGSKVAGREGNIIKLGKARSGAPDHNPKFVKGDRVEEDEGIPPEQAHVSSGKSIEGGMTASEPAVEIPTMRNNKVYSRKHSESRSAVSAHRNDDSGQTPVSVSSSKDHKPLLKFKLKKPNVESQSSSQHEEEKSSVKGQRSKRKRPSPFMEKTSFSENDDRGPSVEDNLMDEIMDANWILKKLGKDAVGKRVEVQQLSDNSWHKGVVSDVIEGTSLLSVTLDDGKVKSLELGKQGVRFVSQKQKRSRT